jgi:hypothetical protein
MSNITYKYNVGDIVELKPKHRIKVKVDGVDNEFELASVKVVERRDYNGPAYRFEGVCGFYKEDCIRSRWSEAPQD